MLSLALSIQQAIYQDKSTQLQQTAQIAYMQHINDISIINDAIWRYNLMDGPIKTHFDQAKGLLKQYLIHLNRIKTNCKIGRPCIWMPTNVSTTRSLNVLTDQMNQLNDLIRTELRICHKKIYRSRRGMRVQSNSY